MTITTPEQLAVARDNLMKLRKLNQELGARRKTVNDLIGETEHAIKEHEKAKEATPCPTT